MAIRTCVLWNVAFQGCSEFYNSVSLQQLQSVVRDAEFGGDCGAKLDADDSVHRTTAGDGNEDGEWLSVWHYIWSTIWFIVSIILEAA